MSLKIWLPLTEDTKNQGLLNLPTPWDAHIRDTGGKLGQYCYSDNAIYHIQNEWLENEWSLACWVKSSSWSQNNDIMLCKNTTSAGSAQFYLSIIGGTWLNIGCNAGSETLKINYTFATDTWYHVTATYDGTTLKLYLNGSEVGTKAYTSTQKTGMNNLGIGCRSTNAAGTSATGGGSKRMNDIRIYDHALSPMEVKQISQGLILHYPLNNNGWGQKNLLINSNVEKSGKSNAAQWFRWNITDSPLVANQYYTLSFDAKITVPTDVFYIGFAQNDSTQEIFLQGVQVISEYKRYIFTGKTTKTNINSIVISNYKNYGRGNGNNTTGTLYIKNMKLELGLKATPWCPNEADELYNKLGLNDNILYDTSGYGNNGTKVGNFDYSSDTPKYNVSMVFNGTDNCIQLENISSLLQDVFTINLWFKKDDLGSKTYETLFGGPSGFEMDTRSGSSQTLSLYMTSTRGGNVYSPFDFGEWYMITLVNDGTNELYYVNGELVKTITKKSMPSGNYFIGAWQTNVKQNYKGLISDFRVYTTALSALNVLSLYNNSAYIDNEGNIYGAVYEEV